MVLNIIKKDLLHISYIFLLSQIPFVYLLCIVPDLSNLGTLALLSSEKNAEGIAIDDAIVKAS